MQCDGKNPCIKCSSRVGATCTYEISLKASKAEMKRENTELRQQNFLYTQILTALSAGSEVAAILRGLQNQVDLDAIVQLIASSPSSSPAMKRSPTMNSSDEDTEMTSIPLEEKDAGKLADDDPTQNQVNEKKRTSKTREASSQTDPVDECCSLPTSIKQLRDRACRGPTKLSDHKLIKHLFSVYWIWVHPSHTILSMEHFVQAYESGTEMYCSLYLIYAVCIAACENLDPFWENVEGKSTNVAELKENLVTAARIEESTMDPNHNIKTTVQALAIMTLAGAGSRKYSGKSLG